MNDMITTTGRSSGTITTEIRTITRQAQQMLLSAAIQIGQRLIEAKEKVPHGEWGQYLAQEVEFSQSTANNFMRIYEEYGNGQESLFSSNSKVLENLPYTKALRLLVLPAEERAEFAETHDVEAMSTRELEKALKERDEALAESEKLRETISAKDELIDTKNEMIESRDKLVREANARAEKAEAAAEKVAKLEAELKKANESWKRAKKDFAKALENPVVPETVMETMRKEAEAKAAGEVQAQIEKKLAQAKEQLSKAEADRKDAQAKLEAAQKAARISDPDIQAVQVLGQQILAQWNTTLGHKQKAVLTNPENAVPLDAFLKKLLETMQNGMGF